MPSVNRFSGGRDLRFVIVAAVAMLLVAGTAFAASPSSPVSSPSASAEHGATPSSETPDASEAPETADKNDTADGPPSAADITRVVGRLSDAGIKTTDAALQGLATKIGLGGAVRVLAFAHASGKTPAQILSMFQAGNGWGAIRHQLNLSIGPGLGWIMGGGHGGHGGHGGNGGDPH